MAYFTFPTVEEIHAKVCELIIEDKYDFHLNKLLRLYKQLGGKMVTLGRMTSKEKIE